MDSSDFYDGLDRRMERPAEEWGAYMRRVRGIQVRPNEKEVTDVGEEEKGAVDAEGNSSSAERAELELNEFRTHNDSIPGLGPSVPPEDGSLEPSPEPNPEPSPPGLSELSGMYKTASIPNDYIPGLGMTAPSDAPPSRAFIPDRGPSSGKRKTPESTYEDSIEYSRAKRQSPLDGELQADSWLYDPSPSPEAPPSPEQPILDPSASKRKSPECTYEDSIEYSRPKRQRSRDSVPEADSGLYDPPSSPPAMMLSSEADVLDSLYIEIEDENGAGASSPRRSPPPQREPSSPMEDISSTSPSAPTPPASTPPAPPPPASAVVSRLQNLASKPLVEETSSITTPDRSLVARRTHTKLAHPKSGHLEFASVSAPGAAIIKKPSISALRGKKGKSPQVTPAMYAAELQARVVAPEPRALPYLKGLRFFYVGGEMQWASTKTKNRMDILHRHGGIVLPKYERRQTTHIIVDDGVATKVALRALGLKSVADIPPDVYTVRWKWVIKWRLLDGEDPGNLDGIIREVERNDGEKLRVRMDREWAHEVFESQKTSTVLGREFIDVEGKKKTKEGHDEEQQGDGNGEVSDISNFTQENVKGRSASPAGGREGHGQPSEPPPEHTSESFEKFEALARQEREMELAREDKLAAQLALDQHDASIIPGLEGDGAAPKLKGFLCDAPKDALQSGPCPNQDIVDKLEELMELHRAKLTDEDKWRVYSYSKSIRAIRTYPTRIRSYEEARNIRGVGDKTALKIKEILETGELRRIEFEKTEDIEIINLFQGIYGVGRSTAYAWYAAGCRTLDDIRNKKAGIKVSEVQEIGLLHYDDINTRMPREEALEIFVAIKETALSLDPKLFIEIMGSYRRGKSTCGDIDILITRSTEDGKTHEGVLLRLLTTLQTMDIIQEHLSLPDLSVDPLEAVYRGLCVRPLREGEGPEVKRLRRRIDFLTVPWINRGAALIYYTGDDIFNRSLRLKANKMGYSLNQKGLSVGVVRSPTRYTVKLCDGRMIASETEEEIFRILGVPWQEPNERVRSV